MKGASYFGAGVGEGLERATGTLLQTAVLKRQLDQKEKDDNIKNKYNEMMIRNQEMMAQAYINQTKTQQGQEQAFQAGRTAVGASEEATGDNMGQPNAVGFFSAGGSPATTQPSNVPQQQIYMSASGKMASKPVSSGSSAGVTTQQDIQLAVKGVSEGKIPPERVASFRDVTRVNAELERQGINMSDLTLEWDATKKAVQTMNGPQQIRLRQAIGFGLKSTGDIIKMSDELGRGPNPILNRAQLNAAKQGLLGPDMQKKATLLDQQIADTVSDLGQVYMGGNSPTDEGLKLAGQNMKGEWSGPQLKAAAQNVQKLLNFRMNSINNIHASVPGGEVKGTYGKGAVKQEENKEISLPDTIKTTSQAVDYLMENNNMTKEEAIEWIRSQ